MATKGLESSFDFIDPSAKLFGKDKSIAKLLKRDKLGREDVVYVGDETRDIDGAKKAGVRAIAGEHFIEVKIPKNAKRCQPLVQSKTWQRCQSLAC